MFGICQIVLWLIESLVDHSDHQKNYGTLENVQIPSFKPYINSYAWRKTAPTLEPK